MEKRTFWPFSVKNFPQDTNIPVEKCEDSFMNTAATDTHYLLDGLLLEVRIKESLEKAQVLEDVFDDRYELFNLYNRDRKVEKFKMLSEVKEPFVDLEKCSLHELISILQKFASDPSVNVNQAGFGSYIANHVLKKRLLGTIKKL